MADAAADRLINACATAPVISPATAYD